MSNPTSARVESTFRDFFDKHEGKTVGDHFGAQSPALVEAYISELIGRPFHHSAATAVNWWFTPDVISAGFSRVSSLRDIRRGDVVVFVGSSPADEGTGTVGIASGPAFESCYAVPTFTQGPKPSRVMDLPGRDFIGAFRFALAEPRHTPGQVDAGLARLDAELRSYLAAPGPGGVVDGAMLSDDAKACISVADAYTFGLYDSVDRRTRARWALLALREAGIELLEALKLTVGLWRKRA